MSPRAALLLLCGATLLPGCGYRIVRPDLGSGRSILVPVPQNDTGWQGIEAELAADLRDDLQRQLDLELSSAAPDYVLETRITEVGRDARVSRRGGGAALGTARVRIDWTLRARSAPAGENLASGRVIRELEFLTAYEEDPYSIFPDLLANMAEQIVLEVGAGLDEAVTAP